MGVSLKCVLFVGCRLHVRRRSYTVFSAAYRYARRIWFECLCWFYPDRLAEHSLHLSNCAIINISISSIDIFVRVNTIYATFFGASPPARACISVDLPEGIRVCLDCIAFTEYDPGARQALHVQGLSYWAPANIGPYSQAITVSLCFWLFSCPLSLYRLVNESSSLVRLVSSPANWLYRFLVPWIWRRHYLVNTFHVLRLHLERIQEVVGWGIHNWTYIG